MTYNESLNAYILESGFKADVNKNTLVFLVEDNVMETKNYYVSYNDGEHGKLPVMIKVTNIKELTFINNNDNLSQNYVQFVPEMPEAGFSWNPSSYLSLYLDNLTGEELPEEDIYYYPSQEEFERNEYVYIFWTPTEHGNEESTLTHWDRDFSLSFDYVPPQIVKKIKTKKVDGTFEEVFLGANAQYVTLENGDTLEDVLNWTEV